MPRRLRDSVVVVTGASSGIGRATALALARRGATVVVAARREEALRELVEECQRLGAMALAVPTDVTDEGAVQALARRALEEFGRMDVWVNNAAVALFGRLEESPPEAYRRVIETNLFGYVYGARAAIPAFREQGSGVLVNVSSIVGVVGQPYTSAYVLSKFAIRGLSASLRMELQDVPDIHVCTVLPATVDTPLFQHAANYTGRAVRAMPPVEDAREVAEAIVGCAEEPQREVFVGSLPRAVAFLRTVAPELFERAYARQVERAHFRDLPASPTAGNLFAPMPQWTGVSGGWRMRRRGALPGVVVVGAVALVPALLAWLWLRR